MKKTVLITGTSSGLGLATALLFARNNFKVYATMRNLSKKELLEKEAQKHNLDISFAELDVTSVDSINQAVAKIIGEEETIDVLINNAGAGFAKTTEQASDEEIEWVIATNFLSVVRCTRAVLPVMRRQRSGHIINISSVGGLVGQPFNEIYCAAKFAVEGYTEALATYLTRPFGIRFTAIEPGGIVSEFTKSATAKTLGTTGLPNDEYLPIIQQYLGERQKRAAAGDTLSFQQPEEVAQVILETALSENPPIRKRTSPWAEELCHFKTDSDPAGTLQNEQVISQFLG